MVQSKKNEIEVKILETAKAEFLEFGFKDSSIRNISAKSGIPKSNIYTYFESKDTLFKEIIKNTILHIELNLEKMKNPENYPPETYGFKYHIYMIEQVSEFVDRHRENLKLLIFKSEGSSYENYLDKTIDHYTELSVFQTKYFIEQVQCRGREVSKFMIHSIVSCYANFVKEIIMHEIPLNKIKEYGKEFMVIFYYGSKALLGWDDKWDNI